ncbi:MAG: thiamine-phosphate kinase [Thermoplasmata archaeon]
MKIGDVGERSLIERIWSVVGRENEDEDVHFFSVGNRYVLLAMDTINENFHFDRDWDPELVGRFLVDINLSDIAAKNGSPLEMMASFSLPRDLDESWVLSLVKGITEEASRYGVTFQGGDLKESLAVSLTGLVIGEVEEGKEFRRRGARPGDFVYATSLIGRVERAILNFYRSSGDYRGILDVRPRFDALETMRKYRVTSCIDNSDGLYKSLGLISKLSGVRILIENDVSEGASDEGERDLFFSMGGDYELIFTSPDVIREFPLIGKVSEGEGVFDRSGRRINTFGYDHFSPVLLRRKGR